MVNHAQFHKPPTVTGSLGRRINYLRLSITDRCNLRCVYCSYWRDWEHLAPSEILRYEELLRLVRAATEAGISKVRITGGEPLVRRGATEFIKDLHKIPGITQICLTTNGVSLEEMAGPLFDAGVRHLNISLDTLRRDRNQQITGADHLVKVLAGLAQATALGFHAVKINCVALKGINDDEILTMARLVGDWPYQVRFIELMPTVSRKWWQRHFMPMAEVRRRLMPLGALIPVESDVTAGPARIFRVGVFAGELGFISPMSAHHCSSSLFRSSEPFCLSSLAFIYSTVRVTKVVLKGSLAAARRNASRAISSLTPSIS